MKMIMKKKRCQDDVVDVAVRRRKVEELCICENKFAIQ